MRRDVHRSWDDPFAPAFLRLQFLWPRRFAAVNAVALGLCIAGTASLLIGAPRASSESAGGVRFCLVDVARCPVDEVARSGSANDRRHACTAPPATFGGTGLACGACASESQLQSCAARLNADATFAQIQQSLASPEARKEMLAFADGSADGDGVGPLMALALVSGLLYSLGQLAWHECPRPCPCDTRHHVEVRGSLPVVTTHERLFDLEVSHVAALFAGKWTFSLLLLVASLAEIAPHLGIGCPMAVEISCQDVLTSAAIARINLGGSWSEEDCEAIQMDCGARIAVAASEAATAAAVSGGASTWLGACAGLVGALTLGCTGVAKLVWWHSPGGGRDQADAEVEAQGEVTEIASQRSTIARDLTRRVRRSAAVRPTPVLTPPKDNRSAPKLDTGEGFVEDSECCICLEPCVLSPHVSPENAVAVLQCGHIFHEGCIAEWFQSSHASTGRGERADDEGVIVPRAFCPVCRSDIVVHEVR